MGNIAKYIAGFAVGLLGISVAIGAQKSHYESKLARARTAVITQIKASDAEAQFYGLLESHFLHNPNQDEIEVDGRFYQWDSVNQGIKRSHVTLDNRHFNLLELAAPEREDLDQMLLEEPYLDMYNNRTRRYNEQSLWLQALD